MGGGETSEDQRVEVIKIYIGGRQVREEGQGYQNGYGGNTSERKGLGGKWVENEDGGGW